MKYSYCPRCRKRVKVELKNYFPDGYYAVCSNCNKFLYDSFSLQKDEPKKQQRKKNFNFSTQEELKEVIEKKGIDKLYEKFNSKHKDIYPLNQFTNLLNHYSPDEDGFSVCSNLKKFFKQYGLNLKAHGGVERGRSLKDVRHKNRKNLEEEVLSLRNKVKKLEDDLRIAKIGLRTKYEHEF